MSRSVDDLGEGSLTDGRRGVSAHDWCRVGGDNRGVVGGDKRGVVVVGESWSSIAGNNWSVDGVVSESANWVVDDAGVSVSEGGGGEDSRGDETTLLPSGTGKSLSMSNSVGSTGLGNLWGLLNGSKWLDGWNSWSYWSNWKGVAGNTETGTISHILNADLLTPEKAKIY